MHSERLVLVDENDVEIGSGEKLDIHKTKGMRHRAFSFFLVNSHGEVYVQQRSLEKMLWPMYWSNSCCSHPCVGESVENAVSRRIREELGIELSAKPEFLYKFWYESSYEDIGFENEICHVYFAISDQEPVPNPNEINSYIYVHYTQLGKLFFNERSRYTPWFKSEWTCIMENHIDTIKRALENSDRV